MFGEIKNIVSNQSVEIEKNFKNITIEQSEKLSDIITNKNIEIQNLKETILNLIIIPAFNIITLIKIIFAFSVKSVKSTPYIIRKTITSCTVYSDLPILVGINILGIEADALTA